MLILEVGSKDRGGSAAAPLLHDPIISRSPKTDSGDYALIGVVGIAGVLILRRVIPRLGPSLDTSENPDVYVSPIKQVLEHEERSFAEFATAFRVGPTALRADNEDKEATREPKWFEDKSKETKAVRDLIAELEVAHDDMRQRILTSLAEERRSLSRKLGVAEQIPGWQLSTSVQGLLSR